MVSERSGKARTGALVLTGLLGGLLSGLFGVGGGIVMVPLLMWLVRMDQRRAAATSLVAIVPGAAVGALSYFLRGDVDILAGLLIAAGGMAGSILGTKWLRTLPLGVLRWLFIGLLLLAAVQTFLDVPVRVAELEITWLSALGLLVLGVFMGIASGLLGIGGGLIAVPALMLAFSASDVLAKGTSLLAMLPTAILGSVRNTKASLVNPRDGVIAGVAAVPMSVAGVALAFYLDPKTASILLGILLVATAAQLAWRAYNASRRSDS
jgi:uncharacterized membrane protein YfcA